MAKKKITENKKILEEPEDKVRNYISGFFKMQQSLIDKNFEDVDRRLSELEEFVYRTRKKPPLPRRQKMLIMQHLGLLNPLRELNIPSTKMAEVLHLLLDSDKSNLIKDLQIINQKDSDIHSVPNYEALCKVFKKLKIDKIEVIMEAKLLEARNLKEKKASKK